MKTEQIIEEWMNDSQINLTDLTRCSAEVPLLHAKYVRELVAAKVVLNRLEGQLKSLKRDKKKYFNGEMTREELEQYGWTQYQGIKPLKSELNEIISLDKEYIELEAKVSNAEAKVSILESILTTINNRNWSIKNVIDWEKFQNGVN